MRRIPFQKIYNLRELGGFPISLSKATNYHRFLRSDALVDLTPEEIEFLKNYQITTIIDLRNDEEIRKLPNILKDNPNFKYFHVPLLNTTNMRDDKNKMSAALYTRTLDDIYLEIIESELEMKQIFTIIAKETGILYHCSAGKDRTGVTTAILLMLAGVNDLDIVSDYEISFTLLTPRTKRLQEVYPDLKMHIMESRREVMANFLEHFHKTYGTADAYLLKIGLSTEEILVIKNKLIN